MEITRRTRPELIILLPLLFLFAWATEDPNATECTDRGGVVETDSYPDGREYRVCIAGDQIVSVWRPAIGKRAPIIWGY